MTRPRRCVAVVTLAGALAAAPRATAQGLPPPEQASSSLSPYEKEAVAGAAKRLGSEVDPAPEGKLIESIEVLPHEVLEARDLPSFLEWAQILNYLHGTTRPYVLRQEVLVREGEPWRQALVDETARNLRLIRQLSLVLLVPLRGSSPDRVRLVVITKDIWSLRLNTNFRFAGGHLDYLTLQPSEENLFGTHQSVGFLYNLDPATYSLGGRYSIRRIGGSRLEGKLEANVIVNRDDPGQAGEVEGSRGSFAFGQPLYATAARWGWSTRISWRDEITRRYVGGALDTYDARSTPGDDAIPYRWKTDRLLGVLSVTRGFGSRFRHEISASIEGDRKVARTDDLSAFAPAAAAEFVRGEVPVSDTRIGPAASFRSYDTRYLRVLDMDTLALQEDYSLGHELSFRVYPSIKAFKSTRNYLGIEVGAAYAVPLGDGLARVAAGSVTEMESDRLADGAVDLGLRVMTPTFKFARLAYDTHLLYRYRNYQNRHEQLGGESRLRGYPTLAFLGKDAVTANLELRTKPVSIWSVQLGAAAFFDTGDAFDGFETLRLKRSVGFGVRALVPMLDRVVIRADCGFPLDREFAPSPVDVVITMMQAFPLPRRTPAESF